VRIAPERQTLEAIKGERKTVTAPFADIKGSMELIEYLEPDESKCRVRCFFVQNFDRFALESFISWHELVAFLEKESMAPGLKYIRQCGRFQKKRRLETERQKKTIRTGEV